MSRSLTASAIANLRATNEELRNSVEEFKDEVNELKQTIEESQKAKVRMHLPGDQTVRYGIAGYLSGRALG